VFASVVHLTAIWLVIFLAFAAIGRQASQRLGGAPSGLFGDFWVGTAAVLLALQWWNLFFAVSSVALALVAVAAVASAVAVRTTLTRPRAWWLLALPLVAWVAGRALQPSIMQDSGLYHLGAVRWAASFPVVPGIANLHPFLGVSHGFFPLAALLSWLPWSLPVHHVPNGLFVLAFVGRLVELAARRTPWSLGVLALVPAAVLVAVLPEVSTVSSDVLEFTLAGAFVCAWVEAAQAPGERGLLLRATLLVVAVTVVKLSSVGALLAVVAVVIARRCWRAGWVVALGLVPWLIGGVVRTGVWPYPGAVVRLPVDWRVPDQVALELQQWTLAAGRMSHPWDATGWAWFAPRLEQLAGELQACSLPVLAAVLALAVTAPRWWRDRRMVAALVAPVVLAGAVWLVSSPLLRYAGVWLQASFAVALVIASRSRPVLIAGLALTALRVLVLVEELNLSVPAVASLEVPPTPGQWVELNGLRRYVPDDHLLCWNAPLPCTPWVDPALRLRDPSSLAGGFRLEGDLATLRPPSLALFPEPTKPR
jgi:hypothetical protein